MTRRELNRLADRLAAGARRTVLRNGHHEPTVYLEISGVPIYTAVSLASPKEKALVRELLEILARGGAQVCGLIGEGWRATMPQATAWLKRARTLSTMPGRQEVLFVEVACPAGHALRVFAIEKRGAVVSLRPEYWGESAGSRFLTALPWRKRRGLREKNKVS